MGLDDTLKDYIIVWAVDVYSWNATQTDVSRLVALLPEAEQEHCQKFHRLIDAKRALVSRLLQRHLGQQLLNSPDLSSVPIARTARGKPFFTPSLVTSTDQIQPSCPAVSFNVSHEVRLSAAAAAAR